MYRDALVPPASSRNTVYVDGADRRRPQSEARSRRSMAEHGTITDRQHGGHVARRWQQRQVPDGVDAAMDLVQPPGCDPMLHRSTADASREQLLSAHDPVLARGKLGDDCIQSPVRGFGVPMRCSMCRTADSVARWRVTWA